MERPPIRLSSPPRAWPPYVQYYHNSILMLAPIAKAKAEDYKRHDNKAKCMLHIHLKLAKLILVDQKKCKAISDDEGEEPPLKKTKAMVEFLDLSTAIAPFSILPRRLERLHPPLSPTRKRKRKMTKCMMTNMSSTLMMKLVRMRHIERF
jgi:hypothetical protein